MILDGLIHQLVTRGLHYVPWVSWESTHGYTETTASILRSSWSGTFSMSPSKHLLKNVRFMVNRHDSWAMGFDLGVDPETPKHIPHRSLSGSGFPSKKTKSSTAMTAPGEKNSVQPEHCSFDQQQLEELSWEYWSIWGWVIWPWYLVT